MSDDNQKEVRIIPKDEDMKRVLAEISSADKTIIINVKYDSDGDSKSQIYHTHNTSIEEAAEELQFWANIYRGRANASAEMKTILKDNGITGE